MGLDAGDDGLIGICRATPPKPLNGGDTLPVVLEIDPDPTYSVWARKQKTGVPAPAIAPHPFSGQGVRSASDLVTHVILPWFETGGPVFLMPLGAERRLCQQAKSAGARKQDNLRL